jgi:HK97 family phage portal protein
MRLFGREIRSQPKQKSRVEFSSDDAEFAKMLGIELDGLSADKAKEATFFTCLRIMTDSVSKLPLKLHQSTDEGTIKSDDHYLYNLLKLRPNKLMSSSTFWKMVEYQRNYYGHSVVAINFNQFSGRVESLIPLEMEHVKILIDDKGLLGDELNALYYTYTVQGKTYNFKHDSVLHFLGLTKNGVQGMAIKDYLKTLVENAQASSAFTNNYLNNGLHSKGIISYVGDLDESRQKELQARFKRLAGGVDNAGSLLPLPIGFDYKNISTNMADAQFTELAELNIRQIASAFGVKMHQLNDSQHSTNASLEQQQKGFYVDTLQPILTAYEQELSYKLLTSEEIKQGYFFQFNVDAILRTQSKERAEYLSTLVEGGIMTSNEARGVIDLTSIEGADELLINGSYLPLKDAVAGKNYVSKEVNPDNSEGGD